MKNEYIKIIRLIQTTEPYIHKLRKYLENLHDSHPENRNLSAICSFYLLTALTLLKGIQTLAVHDNHFSASTLARSLVEICVNLGFILQKDSEERAAEMIKSSNEKRIPYTNKSKYKKYDTIKKRAKAAGLEPTYHKSYLPLCSYSHIRPSSWLAFDPFKSRSLIRLYLKSSVKFYQAIVQMIAVRYKYPIPSNLQIISINQQQKGSSS